MNELNEEPAKQENENSSIIKKIDELNQKAWEIHTIQPKDALELSMEAKVLSEKNNYLSGLAYSIRNMGVSHRHLSNYETALSLSLLASEMFEKINDKSGEAQAYVSSGAIYYYMGDYERGLDYFLKGLLLAEDIGNLEAQAYGYNGAGYIYGILGDNKKGLDFLHKALEISKEIHNDDLQASILDSLAVGFLNDGQLDKALETYNECIDFCENTNLKRVQQGYALQGIGLILIKQGQEDKAKDYFLKSLSIHQEIDYKTGLASTLLALGKLYLKQNNIESAHSSLINSLDVAESIKAKAVIYEVHESLAELYEHLQDFNSFVEHYKLFHKFKSEVFKEEQESKQKYLAARQEMDKLKQESEISRLTNVVLKEKNDELEKKTNELEQSYNNISVLSRIGQDITATLNLETILNTVYENVNKLMDASVFGIGMYNQNENVIEYKLAIEKGKLYQPYIRTMEDKNQFPVWCIENKKEIFINNVKNESKNYISEYVKVNLDAPLLEDGTFAEIPVSLIYLPLQVKDKIIGIITVQSFYENAYSSYQLDILKTLASYTAAALFNAQTYEKIQNTLIELKQAQEQLVQAEKLSSLGQLTAGIAHEINNPINFVSSNIEPLKLDLAEILELINKYEKVIKDNNLEEIFTDVEKFRKEYDIEFTMREVEGLLEGIEEGAKRTSEIVKGLRNFSRLDQNVAKMSNLNEGLETTLVLLHNSYKHNIEVVKDYGDIPEINCFPGQINQVFMNIISNAVQAINGTGKIFIKSWSDGDMVKISVKDTGSGMSEDVSKKIFDPFFTTKEIGKGTGLGLSITYGIIEKHKGKIEVFSVPGTGTEFIILLPINQLEIA